MTTTDVTGLTERYAELLRIQRSAETPVEKTRIRLEMVQIELALSRSQTDFYLCRLTNSAAPQWLKDVAQATLDWADDISRMRAAPLVPWVLPLLPPQLPPGAQPSELANQAARQPAAHGG